MKLITNRFNKPIVTMTYSLREYLYILCCSLVISASAQPQIENCVWTTFTFEHGEKASEGCLVDGKPEGEWKTFYENGILKSKGSRKVFELDGLWEFYYENGTIQRRVEFEKGQKNGKKWSYDENGTLLTESAFNNNIQVENQRVYDPAGWLKKRIPFAAGKPHGWGREWASDGRVIALFEYDQGRLRSTQRINALDDQNRKTGLWMEWNSMERKTEEGPWRAGKRHGVFKFYDGFGQLDYLEKYEFGEVVQDTKATTPVDVRTTVHPNGVIATRATYSEGELVGVWREYDDQGTLESGALYERNKKVADGITDEQGRRMGAWVWYDDMGQKKSTGNYLLGKEEGLWEYFSNIGQIIQEGSFKNGRYHGGWTWYYPDGSKHRKEWYRNGQENGDFTEWSQTQSLLNKGVYENGLKQGIWIEDVNDHREEGNYLDGLKNDEWTHYDADGAVRFEGNYSFGLPDGKHVFYRANGSVWRIERYEGGAKEGKWKVYNAENLIEQIIEYRQGEMIKVDGQSIQTRRERRVTGELKTEAP